MWLFIWILKDKQELVEKNGVQSKWRLQRHRDVKALKAFRTCQIVRCGRNTWYEGVQGVGIGGS